MICARLGINQSQFRSIYQRGIIQADEYNDGNNALYSEAKLQLLINKQIDGSLFKTGNPVHPDSFVPTVYSADDGVRVFELLEAKKPLHIIAIETRLHPQVVRRIAEDYIDMVEGIIVPRAILDQMNKLTLLPGRFPLRCATDVLEVMTNAATDRLCPCGNAPMADLCMSCIRGRLKQPPQAPSPPPSPGDQNLNGAAAVTGSKVSGSAQNPRHL